MTVSPFQLLVKVLSNPAGVGGMSLADWDCLVRIARRAGLLARLGETFTAADVFDAIPNGPRRHMQWEMTLSRKHIRDVRWEVERIRRALSKQDIPAYFLKGAAYVMAKLPAAQGRLFSDIDILVRREQIEEAEQAFLDRGWFPGAKDPYDIDYYRRWMHQIPPIQHFARQTTIDLHHTIVPLTARMTADAEQIFANAVPVKGYLNCYVLSPADMVIHSAAHLFNEGEFDRGLRDLSDLDLLFRCFGEKDGFWRDLRQSASRHGLSEPLFYAASFAKRYFQTPIPDDLLSDLQAEGPIARLRLALMGRLFHAVLSAPHPMCRSKLTGISAWLLYVRGHWLRMPLRLLIPHLVRKSYRRRILHEK